MPRKPTRHRGFFKHRPLTFSSFARLAAQVASASTVRRQMNIQEFPPPNSGGKKLVKNSSKAKRELAESSDEDEFDGNVQVDFAFFDPKPDDFHGVKALLQTYLDDEEWDLSGFADIILGQTTVGSLVKTEDEDNGIFALVTALNLGRYKDHECVKEIKKYLLKVSQKKDVLEDLRTLLGKEAGSVGLLVSQRVTNLPPQLLPPLYDGLFQEVSWATEDEPTEELKNSFRFKFYIILSKLYKHKNADQKKKHNAIDEPIIYVKPEDEILHKLSSWSFEFCLQTQPIAAQELKNYQQMGLVMAVRAEKISAFQKQLQSLLEDES